MAREGVGIRLEPHHRARAREIAAVLGVSEFVIYGRLLRDLWHEEYGGEYADELAEMHKEIHGGDD